MCVSGWCKSVEGKRTVRCTQEANSRVVLVMLAFVIAECCCNAVAEFAMQMCGSGTSEKHFIRNTLLFVKAWAEQSWLMRIPKRLLLCSNDY